MEMLSGAAPIVGILIFWILLQRVILPRMGIGT